MTDAARLHAYVDGRVQGVGFRDFVRRVAREFDLAGSAVNRPDGRVEVIAEGPRESCESLLARLRSDDTPGFVGKVDVAWEQPRGEHGFRAG